MKGLQLYVYRDSVLGDCTNGGISARHNRVTVTGVRHGWTRYDGEIQPLPREAQVFEPSPAAPEVTLVIRDNGCIRWYSLEPAEDVPAGQTDYMAGGNFAHTSDSRWRELTGDGRPVAIHDRTETWAQYEALSR